MIDSFLLTVIFVWVGFLVCVFLVCFPYKTVWYVDLDEQAIGGSFPNVEYELMVRVNKDATLNRDFVRQIQKARKKILGKFINMGFYANEVEHYFPTNEPRYYYDPSF